jgi:hypothetical protein
MDVLVAIAVLLVVVLVFALGRAMFRGAAARSGEPDRAAEQAPVSAPAPTAANVRALSWSRSLSLPSGRIDVYAGEQTGSEHGASTSYEIKVHEEDDTRAISAIVEDWPPNELIASDDNRWLAFIRVDEELRDVWETRAHIVDLADGRVVACVAATGRHKKLEFNMATVTLSTDLQTRSEDLPSD